MIEPLRVGLVGAGWVSNPHAEGWLAVNGKAQVVAVADIDLAAANELCRLLNARAYADYRDMLERERIDAIDICVPPHLHVEIVGAAAAKGIHILCEKPLARDMEEAKQIENQVTAAGITYMPAHNSVFYPTTRAARAYIDSGDLGEIYFTRTTEHYVSVVPRRWRANPLLPPQPDLRDTWRGSKTLLNGGALMDGGYHAVYRLLYLTTAQPVSVIATIAKLRSGVEWEAEDTAAITVRFDDGSLGEALATYAFDTLGDGKDRLFALAGHEGVLAGNEHTLFMKPSAWQESASQCLSPLRGTAAWRASIAAEIEHFVDCVVNARSAIQSFSDAKAALQVVRAAYESAETGQAVTLASAAKDVP